MEWESVTMEQLRANRPDLVDLIGSAALDGLEGEINTVEGAVGTTPPAESDRGAQTSALEQRMAQLESENARLRAGRIVDGRLAECSLSDGGKALLRKRFEGASALKEADFDASVAAEITALGEHEKRLLESVRAPGAPVAPSGETFNLGADLRSTWGVKDGEK